MVITRYSKVDGSTAAGSVPLTYGTDSSPWHNQLAITRGTATAGTCTISYVVASVTHVLKDSNGVPLSISLATAPEPIQFDGLIDSIVVNYSGVNGSFKVSLVGQHSG